ncbi:MAG: hypothetical protein HY376_03085 [Candidatus Blackburnbacteria bacterium]|nr:hypothetical protein [Candidatus Blackburnbacteria bacterium]
MPPSPTKGFAKTSIIEELEKLEIEQGKKGKYKVAKRELEIELKARNDAFEKGLEIFNATLEKLEASAKERYNIGDMEISMITNQLSDGFGNLSFLNEQKEWAFLKFFQAICEKKEKKDGE